MNYLILRNNSNDMIFKYINDKNIYNTFIYTKNNKICHMIMKYNLPLSKLLFGRWKKHIKDIDKVILFDTMMYPCITRYIKRKNKKCKIYLYFWNSINDSNKYLLNDKNIDEYYTFDLNDSKKYKISYNHQFYTNKIKETIKKKYDYDLLFLGRSKNRDKELLKIKKICDKNNLNLNLNIIDHESKLISYDKYLNMLNDTKAILDITANNQKGLSLRVMESIFLNKKLITNNKSVMKYDFYLKDNIFILGIDKIENLNDFINKPYKKIDKKIINNYDYKNWLNNFK